MVTASLFAVGCKKDTLPTSSAPEQKTSQQDFLVVKDAQEFNRLLSTVPFLSKAEYDNWKKANGGFRSLYDRYESLVKALDNVQSKEEALALMKKESDYFYLDSLGRIESKVGWMLSHLLNQDGILEANGAINKHVNGELFFAKANTKAANILLNRHSQFNNLKAAAVDLSIRNTGTIQRSVHSNEDSYIGNIPLRAAVHNYYLSDPGAGNSAKIYGWRKGYFITQAQGNNRKIFADLIYEISVIREWAPLTNQNYYYNAVQKTYLKFSHQRKTVFGWNNYTTQLTLTNLTWSSSAGSGSIAPHTTTGSESSQHFYDIIPQAPALILEAGIPVSSSYSDITLSGTSPVFYSFNLTANNQGGATISNYSFSGDVSWDIGTIH